MKLVRTIKVLSGFSISNRKLPEDNKMHILKIVEVIAGSWIVLKDKCDSHLS